MTAVGLPHLDQAAAVLPTTSTIAVASYCRAVTRATLTIDVAIRNVSETRAVAATTARHGCLHFTVGLPVCRHRHTRPGRQVWSMSRSSIRAAQGESPRSSTAGHWIWCLLFTCARALPLDSQVARPRRGERTRSRLCCFLARCEPPCRAVWQNVIRSAIVSPARNRITEPYPMAEDLMGQNGLSPNPRRAHSISAQGYLGPIGFVTPGLGCSVAFIGGVSPWTADEPRL